MIHHNSDPVLTYFWTILLFYLKNSEVYIFADDNTPSAIFPNKNNLIQTIEQDSDLAVEWFRKYNMISNNLDKFKAILLQQDNGNK